MSGAREVSAAVGGPSTDAPGPVSGLVAQGMHVARLNFSHAGADYAYPEANVALVRAAAGRHAQLATGSKMPMPQNLRAILVDVSRANSHASTCVMIEVPRSLSPVISLPTPKD